MKRKLLLYSTIVIMIILYSSIVVHPSLSNSNSENQTTYSTSTSYASSTTSYPQTSSTTTTYVNTTSVITSGVDLPSFYLGNQDIPLGTGSMDLNFVVQSQSAMSLSNVSPIISKTSQLLSISSSFPKKITLDSNESKTVDITISTSENIVPGTYKILLGAQIPDVSISKFITLIIQP